MRILYVISGFGFGGAEKQLIELARELKSRGHDVTIYTLTRHVPRAADLERSGVTVIIDQKRRRFDPAVLLRLRSTLQRWRPDLIHGFLFDGNFYSRLAALGTDIPVLNSERSDRYRLSPVQQIAHRLTRRWVDGVVANTYSGARFARDLFRLPSEHVHVVWNGIRIQDLEREAAAPAIDCRAEFFGERGVRIACLVGSIRPPKDYHLALDAAACLIALDPAWRVLLVGDLPALQTRHYGKKPPAADTYKAEILSHYERLGVKDKIRICGLRTDLPSIMRQSDVLYVTSVYEGFPNAVLEAMTLGVPVVSTEYSDIQRILPFRRQIVATRNAGELARAVIWAHSERELIARRQKQWVCDHASIEGAAENLESVYNKYVGGSSMPALRSGAVKSDMARAAPAQLEHDR